MIWQGDDDRQGMRVNLVTRTQHIDVLWNVSQVVHQKYSLTENRGRGKEVW